MFLQRRASLFGSTLFRKKETELQSELDAFWMPFSANRQFKKQPRMLTEAKGMYYKTDDGRELLDGCSGLWCVNAGHGRPEIVEAISKQAEKLDYATCFQMGNPVAFEFAERLRQITPDPLNHVFFTNSGSESVDTALKIALAYHKAKGNGQKTHFIGREKAYHGVGFGGMSVGGIASNRHMFGSLLPNVHHLKTTRNLEHNAFSKGLPKWGAHLADELEEKILFHGPENIAAVIVEPIIGSGGAVPPPEGYLKRVKEICDQYDALLIFDEVITGFGRVGDSFAANRFGITPDIITSAKGLSNGAVPLGAVFVSEDIYDVFMNGPEYAVEFPHGYTYSGHPLACAAGLATLDIYQKDNLFERARKMEDYLEEKAHTLKDLPNVIDIRNFGMIVGVEFAPIEGSPGLRGQSVFINCFQNGCTVRLSGDMIALAPALIIEEEQIDHLIEVVGKSIQEAA